MVSQVARIVRDFVVHWSVLVLLMSALGCGGGPADGPKRYALTGTVKYRDAPVAQAELFFAPDGEQGNQGPSSTAIAADGKYSLAASTGIVGGAYKVRITSQSPVPLKEGETFTPQFPIKELTVELPKSGGTYDLVIPEGK